MQIKLYIAMYSVPDEYFDISPDSFRATEIRTRHVLLNIGLPRNIDC
jgi:hypothetical protein